MSDQKEVRTYETLHMQQFGCVYYGKSECYSVDVSLGWLGTEHGGDDESDDESLVAKSET